MPVPADPEPVVVPVPEVPLPVVPVPVVPVPEVPVVLEGIVKKPGDPAPRAV